MPEVDLFELNTGAQAAGTLNEELYVRELKQCAKAGGDAAALHKAGFNSNQLEQIRQGLEAGLDTSVYAKPQYSWMDMEEIRKGLQDGIDMSKYRAAGFSTEQKREIRKGIQNHLDVTQYAKKEYISGQMQEIRLGLQDELPIIFYKDPAFLAAQMHEIRLGLIANIDISVYAKPEMPYLKMRAIREGLESGLSFTPKEIEKYDAGILDQLCKAYLDGVEIKKYVEEGYNTPQLEQIRISLEEGLNFEAYIRKDMRGESLKEIRLGIEANVDVKYYANPEYTWRQMRQIRLGLENRVNVHFYKNALFESNQMRQIRLGLQKGLDVTRYNSLVYTASDMRMIRLAMEKGEDSGRKPERSSFIPEHYEDPIIPVSERPNTKVLISLIAKEAVLLKARKEGKIPVSAEAEKSQSTVAEAVTAKLTSEENAELHSLKEISPEEIIDGLFNGLHSQDDSSDKIADRTTMSKYLFSVSPDKMSCTLSLPEPAEGVKYKRDQVVELLERRGIKYGLDIEAIDSIIHKGKYDEKVTVAVGKPAVPGKDGYYEYFFDRASLSNPKFSEDGSADFSDVRFFAEVKAGQEIIKYHKAESGISGITVTGEKFPARSGLEKPIMKGRGFILLPDKQTYAAAVSGVVKIDGYNLNINKLLILDDEEQADDVIEFLGSIHVKCNLKAGTRIKAQGDIIFDTVAEALHIDSGGEIIFKASAVGQGEGTIRAGGAISAKALNHCVIHCGGTVFANSVINCSIYTNEKVVCFGDNGTIFGGYIEAKLGTESAIVGSKAGTPTRICIGVTTKMWGELKEAEKKKERIATQIETLAAELNKLSGVKLQTREQLQWKVKISAAYSVRQTELEEATAEVDEISARIRSVEGAQALIGQTLYAGTTFAVDDTVIHITETKETETGIVIKGKEKSWHREKSGS